MLTTSTFEEKKLHNPWAVIVKKFRSVAELCSRFEILGT